jgi:hypothetical protein
MSLIFYGTSYVPFSFQTSLPFLEDGLNGMDLPIVHPKGDTLSI